MQTLCPVCGPDSYREVDLPAGRGTLAKVVELVDTLDSKSNACKGVWVRVPPLVQKASSCVRLFNLRRMTTVYAIRSLHRNYIYVGITNNLDRRIKEHNKGYNKKTRIYGPFELIYSKDFPNRSEARKHEKYLKSGTGKEFLKALNSLIITGFCNFKQLSHLYLLNQAKKSASRI